ncbi:hypothetical protein [Cellulomonas xiejunii]|uniref:MarR family transcriptional regulator n=1 Tax=Cellulomonas xiejunii TaxID=2968083 RepID=A0ABY5KUV9_9CELL|nr:hypothetical protein [Cellulomonas xiejunii]MCC2321940.1 hypothetical protein [Cellulomonas xiejunii]UUI73241.1 hypothetical protein NP048_07340 [Cellulomonas xiejunii]
MSGRSDALAPTLSGWLDAQRFALRRASIGTGSVWRRSPQPRATPADVVLALVLADMPAVRLNVERISRHTGLTHAQVLDALADLEDAGRIANGAQAGGRVSLVVPAALEALGVPEAWGIAHQHVRMDPPPPGPEPSGLALAAAFGAAHSDDEGEGDG